MARLVLKFGGTSVAGIPEIENAAGKVAAEIARGHSIAVVVSAMSGVTNQLVEYCRSISPQHDAREYDAVVSSGENVTSGLMALALQKRGIAARSWQGWQLPLISSDAHGKARILEIKTAEMHASLEKGEVAVLAGFQGISAAGRVTTLGRGGSDTTAVALSRGAECRSLRYLYGCRRRLHPPTPRIVPQARKIPRVSYEEMLELASLGAKVLQTRSVEMAMKYRVPVQVLSTFAEPAGSDLPGTLLLPEENIMEQHVVNGIAFSKDEAKITLIRVADRPGVAARIFGPLAAAHINVDMIVQNTSPDGQSN